VFRLTRKGALICLIAVLYATIAAMIVVYCISDGYISVTSLYINVVTLSLVAGFAITMVCRKWLFYVPEYIDA
jgi:capsular polysaccharide biosynthesis protein